MMRRAAFLFVLAIVAGLFVPNLSVLAQEALPGWQPKPEQVQRWSKSGKSPFNYDEQKVPAYTLPDPLLLANGRRVASVESWRSERRPETLQLFREHIYGIRPDTPYEIAYKEVVQVNDVLGVGSHARQVRVTVRSQDMSHAFDFVLAMPIVDKPVPIVILIHNRRFVPLAEMEAIVREEQFWPVKDLLSRGYATAVFHTKHVDPDKRDGYADGIRAVLDAPDSDPETRWGSLSAWGWAASRVLDYALKQPGIDASRTAVVGHSRGGKTALWAGAEDERFKLVYSNNSGCGGAALSRRSYGETVARINRNFPHWFCGTFNQYNGKEADLPIDQHQLMALIAPRGVYVASADEDLWADPRGEYEALVAAGPVYALHGKDCITARAVPPLNTPRHVGATGYHIRTGKHDLTRQDWNYFLDFADRFFAP